MRDDENHRLLKLQIREQTSLGLSRMKMKFPLTRRRFISLSLFAATSAAQANEETIDMSRAVYIAMAGSQHVPFIDPDTDRIAGTIDAGMVPDQLELCSSISKLLVTDGKQACLNIVDVVTGEIATVALDFVPGRITVDPDGLTAALADPRTGRLTLFDPLLRRVLGTVTGPAPLQDMLFGADGHTLYLSGGANSEIAVIDVKAVRMAQPIDTGLPSVSLSLTRSPDGRRLFVQSSNGEVGVVDLDHHQALAPIPADADSTVAFPSATGTFLFIANNRRGTLTVLRDTSQPATTVMKAATGVSIVYTAWFESLALVPSETTRTLLLYDLDALRPAGALHLAAAPARGGVTPDGQKLYLPLPDAGQVAVFDARQRQLVASVPVPGTPSKAFLAGSYGICH
jgi:DNA-binding beta-propeller fold protein YncE